MKRPQTLAKLTLASAASLLALGVGAAHATLIGHWDFEEGSGQTVFDESGSATNHDGTRGVDSGSASDDPAWETTGLPNVPSGTSAKLGFDGSDDWVNVPDNDEQSLLSSSGDTGTIALWFFADNEDQSDSPLFAKNGEYNFRLREEGTDMQLRFDLFGENSNTNNSGPGTAISKGTWHHAAVTWTAGTGGTLYLNGSEYHSYTSTDLSPNGTAPVAIGARAGGSPTAVIDSASFPGDLDDVRLYDEVLTASEVNSLAVVPEPGTYALVFGVAGLFLAVVRRR